MNILIAPNAFKNSLSADAAALAIKEGFEQSELDCDCTCFPVGDGGDGTAELIINALDGLKIETKVHDALGRDITTSMGFIDDGKTAVIEMANASGIRLLNYNELNPLRATSFGTGEQIKAALDKRVNKIIIGMGGSATVDAGIGILTALGIRFLNSYGNDLEGLPESLVNLTAIDISGLDKRVLACEVIVLCDVDNYLLGNLGAATVFGPQKGASADAVLKLEKALEQLSFITMRETGKNISSIKHGGTAGGAAAGLYAFLNAKLVNGIDYFLDLTGFDKALDTANLVITGEGSIDEQTLQGKGPFGVAYRAKRKHLPVIGLAGMVPLDNNPHLQKYFDVLLAIGHQPLDLTAALHNTFDNLKRTSRQIANILALKENKC
jgi:glycerate kinase